MCDSCDTNCLRCFDSTVCYKCVDGFTLNELNKCELIKDKINFDKFKELEEYNPNEEPCDDSENEKQLFSFKFSYVITKGENLAIESEEYNNIIFGITGEERYGLNCLIDVTPNFLLNKDFSRICTQSICTLMAYINCSFNENVPDGIYDFQVNQNSDFGNLIYRAKEEFAPIQINFVDNKIIGNLLDDKIKVIYKGNYSPNEKLYLCPNINSNISDCYEINDCAFKSNNVSNDETVFECAKNINYFENGCINFERIMMKDYCGKYINESFSYKYCANSSKIIFINLYIILIILLFLI